MGVDHKVRDTKKVTQVIWSRHMPFGTPANRFPVFGTPKAMNRSFALDDHEGKPPKKDDFPP